MVTISGDESSGGKVYKMDTIEHDAKFWLVPEWLESQDGDWTQPARIILLDTLPHQKSGGTFGDFVLNRPIPKNVIDGRAKPGEGGYIVVEQPDIRLPNPSKVH